MQSRLFDTRLVLFSVVSFDEILLPVWLGPGDSCPHDESAGRFGIPVAISLRRTKAMFSLDVYKEASSAIETAGR